MATKNNCRLLDMDEDGYHVDIFGAEAKVSPIISNRVYPRYSVPFLHNKRIEQLAKKLDTNNDYVIDLKELFSLY